MQVTVDDDGFDLPPHRGVCTKGPENRGGSVGNILELASVEGTGTSPCTSAKTPLHFELLFHSHTLL